LSVKRLLRVTSSASYSRRGSGNVTGSGSTAPVTGLAVSVPPGLVMK